MSFINRLKRAFSNRNDVKAIESMDNRFKSIEKRINETQKSTIQSIEPSKRLEPVPISTGISNYREIDTPEESTQITKGSYDLGLAAGYTGHSIKSIETSLARIESQMVTKDWFMVQLQQLDRRIEDIEKALGIIKGAIPRLEEQKAAIIKRMPLTPRMEQLLRTVKEAGEISFSDLAIRMNLDISDIRSLLSIMTKRTNAIERFRIHRTGWVKYINDSETQKSDTSSSTNIEYTQENNM